MTTVDQREKLGLTRRSTNGAARVLGSLLFAVGVGIIVAAIAPGGNLASFVWGFIGGLILALGLDLIIGGPGGGGI